MSGPKRPASIVFVCTGNICRSPMAMAIASGVAKQRGLDIRLASAGTAAFDGNRAAEGARKTLAEIGLDLTEHEAQQISAPLLREADLIVAATAGHKAFLQQLDPAIAHKVKSFDDLTGLGDLADPLYGGDDEFREVRDTLVTGMPRVLDALQTAAAAAPDDRPPSR